MTKALSRNALSMGAAAAFLTACSASQLPISTSPSGAVPLAIGHHKIFRYTGGAQTFEVPRGVTHIRVIAVGGNGAGKLVARGGRVSAVIPVNPSETLAIYVGGSGSASNGGFNGGGAGGVTSADSSGYGAGGASDIREGGDALDDRIVVAGGGGGQGYATSRDPGHYDGLGGRGGAYVGGTGKDGCCKHAQNGGDGGSGGNQSQGGAGGKGVNQSGVSGELGSGGAGGSGCVYIPYCGYEGGGGGGGGGGYYGGGGGGGGAFFGSAGSGGGGGGGGGSSYVESSATNVRLERGWKQDQAGMVVLDW